MDKHENDRLARIVENANDGCPTKPEHVLFLINLIDRQKLLIGKLEDQKRILQHKIDQGLTIEEQSEIAVSVVFRMCNDRLQPDAFQEAIDNKIKFWISLKMADETPAMDSNDIVKHIDLLLEGLRKAFKIIEQKRKGYV